MAVQPTLQGSVSAAKRLYAQAAAPESSKRSGTAENDRCAYAVWPSSSRKIGCILVFYPSSEDGGFFTLRAVSPALLLGTAALSDTLPVAGVKERKEV